MYHGMLSSKYISLCLAKDDFDSEGNWTQSKISNFKSLNFASGFQWCFVNSLEGSSVVVLSIHLIKKNPKKTQFLKTVQNVLWGNN